MSEFLANDMHIHVFNFKDLDTIIQMIDEYNYEYIAVHSLSACGGARQANNFATVALKTMLPDRIFAYGAFDYPKEGGVYTPEVALEQVKNLYACGYDGVKMLEGKPDVRKKTGEAINSGYYDLAFAYMEKEGIPLELHVADPEEFWSKNLCPGWVASAGYAWFGGDYTPKWKLEHEAMDVVKRYPDLKISFAHWFFQSASYDRSVDMFEYYPNVFLDVVPGWEMYGNFTKDYDRFRDLFINYSDRIIYGTDNLMVNWREIADSVQRFLKTDDLFNAKEAGLIYSDPEMEIRGINLPQEALIKIMRENMFKLHKTPRKLDYDRILAWAKQYGEDYDEPDYLAAAVEKIKEGRDK